jgi:hypothetical protein
MVWATAANLFNGFLTSTTAMFSKVGVGFSFYLWISGESNSKNLG